MIMKPTAIAMNRKWTAFGAMASWTAAALCRFAQTSTIQKRQRAGAVQNLAAIRTIYGKLKKLFQTEL